MRTEELRENVIGLEQASVKDFVVLSEIERHGRIFRRGEALTGPHFNRVTLMF